jgi:hypothetical protein
MKTELNWKLRKLESEIVSQIVNRAMKMAKKSGIDYSPVTCRMDIIACHNNGCELDLQRLLEADDFNFSHDVFGIASHINRETGKLERFFSPRFSI